MDKFIFIEYQISIIGRDPEIEKEVRHGVAIGHFLYWSADIAVVTLELFFRIVDGANIMPFVIRAIKDAYITRIQ